MDYSGVRQPIQENLPPICPSQHFPIRSTKTIGRTQAGWPWGSMQIPVKPDSEFWGPLKGRGGVRLAQDHPLTFFFFRTLGTEI
jgi:hypothetical protein